MLHRHAHVYTDPGCSLHTRLRVPLALPPTGPRLFRQRTQPHGLTRSGVKGGAVAAACQLCSQPARGRNLCTGAADRHAHQQQVRLSAHTQVVLVQGRGANRTRVLLRAAHVLLAAPGQAAAQSKLRAAAHCKRCRTSLCVSPTASRGWSPQGTRKFAS